MPTREIQKWLIIQSNQSGPRFDMALYYIQALGFSLPSPHTSYLEAVMSVILAPSFNLEVINASVSASMPLYNNFCFSIFKPVRGAILSFKSITLRVCHSSVCIG